VGLLLPPPPFGYQWVYFFPHHLFFPYLGVVWRKTYNRRLRSSEYSGFETHLSTAAIGPCVARSIQILEVRNSRFLNFQGEICEQNNKILCSWKKNSKRFMKVLFPWILSLCYFPSFLCSLSLSLFYLFILVFSFRLSYFPNAPETIKILLVYVINALATKLLTRRYLVTLLTYTI
jgi:hypothetical protein